MTTIQSVLATTKTITFDCYGTLVDWRAGIGQSLAELLGQAVAGRENELYEAHVRSEAKLEAGPYRSYRDVLAATTRQLAREFSVEIPPDREGLLADRLPDWPLFPDTREALRRLKSRYRLGVLSNIDRDLFSGTCRGLGVNVDFVVTAQDVESYKPAHAHFQRMFADHARRDEVLHVAQSLFHDGAPAGELGLSYVWINRYGDANDTAVQPLATYPDLLSLAEAAGC